MRRASLIGTVSLIIFFLLQPPSFAQMSLLHRLKWGVYGLYGNDHQHDLNIDAGGIRVDSPPFHFIRMELELNPGFIEASSGLKDYFFYSVSTNLLCDFLNTERLSGFLLGGVGLIHVWGHPWPLITSLDLIGQAGIGLDIHLFKGSIFRLEYRYRHISDPLVDDIGIDSHNVLWGLLLPWPH